MDSVVAAQGLIKDYGQFRAVGGIDFAISRGECFGFLGPNGAGKTTVMRIISCLISPTAGAVSVFGLNVLDRPSEIKARIGVMPQDDNLDPDLTVLENLIVYARYFDIPRKEALARAQKLLGFVELGDRIGVNIRSLSGGMKRRLLLARALINDPDMIVLDEPTTGLDPHSRRAVWAMVNDLKSQGKTHLLTTHYMEEAEQLCDRVAIMESGGIITLDTPENLMREHGKNLEEVYLKLTGRSLAD